MLLHWLLAMADVLFLVTMGSCAIVLEKRDYHDASMRFRAMLLAFAGVAFCLAINRLSMMTAGQPSSYALRVLFDGVGATLFAGRLFETRRQMIPI